jgi:hypothetical protein
LRERADAEAASLSLLQDIIACAEGEAQRMEQLRLQQSQAAVWQPCTTLESQFKQESSVDAAAPETLQVAPQPPPLTPSSLSPALPTVAPALEAEIRQQNSDCAEAVSLDPPFFPQGRLLKFERASIQKKKWHTPLAKHFKVYSSSSVKPGEHSSSCLIEWENRPVCAVLQCFEGPSQQLQNVLSSSNKMLPHSNDGLFHLIVGGTSKKQVQQSSTRSIMNQLLQPIRHNLIVTTCLPLILLDSI